MAKYTIGLDIGGTKCAVLLGKGEIPERCGDFILDRTAFPTESKKGLEQALQKLYQNIEAMMEKHHVAPADIMGIGVSCGGPLDSKKGIIMGPPNLYGWDYVPIAQMLQERYHIPAHVQNDANACALAEWRFGAARGMRNAVFLTFGTGMGAGLILDGRLYSGTSDMAGEVGHMRLAADGPVGFGKAGSFEGFCSGGGIAQLARAKAIEAIQNGVSPAYCPTVENLEDISAKTVAAAAQAGDATAQSVYRLCGEKLGLGLALITDILNPEVIVIGSIFERSHGLLWPAAKAAWEREALRYSQPCCKIVPALLGDSIGDYAALSVAFQPT